MENYDWVSGVIGVIIIVGTFYKCCCQDSWKENCRDCITCREDTHDNRTQDTTQSYNSNNYRPEAQAHFTRHALSISGNMDPSRPLVRAPDDLPPSYDSVIASGGGLSGVGNESFVHDNEMRDGEELPPPYNFEPPSTTLEQ